MEIKQFKKQLSIKSYNQKINTITIVLICLLCFVLGCKYEDGPAISLRSASKRVEGTYDIVKFEVGGADSTSVIKTQPCYGRITFKYSKDGGSEIYGNRDNFSCVFSGSWGLYDNNKNIKIKFQGNFVGIPPWGTGYSENYTITRLSNNEMNLSITYKNVHYNIELAE